MRGFSLLIANQGPRPTSYRAVVSGSRVLCLKVIMVAVLMSLQAFAENPAQIESADLVDVVSKEFNTEEIPTGVDQPRLGDRAQRDGRSTQTIILNPGYNLVSWAVDSPCDLVSCLIGDIIDNLIVITSYDQGALSYDPAHPEFSTLTSMDHLHGYWFKMTQVDTLNVDGATVNPTTTPISMHLGWNLISYLPAVPENTVDALGSIIENVTAVFGFNNGGLSYYTVLESYSTLEQMIPGQGYWVKLDGDATLTYPAAKPSAGEIEKFDDKPLRRLGLTPTPNWINVYRPPSQVIARIFDGTAGVIEAFDPQGTKCGEDSINADGSFGVMPIYQDDPGTPLIDEGASAEDVIRFKINGSSVCLLPILTWGNFGNLYALNPIDYRCGDADGTSIITISDAVYLINYIFLGGQPPNPELSGDVDCNCVITVSDVVYLISYIFAGGSAPCSACQLN